MTTTTRQPIPIENSTEAMRQAVAERGTDWVYPDEEGTDWLLDGDTCRYLLPDGFLTKI